MESVIGLAVFFASNVLYFRKGLPDKYIIQRIQKNEWLAACRIGSLQPFARRFTRSALTPATVPGANELYKFIKPFGKFALFVAFVMKRDLPHSLRVSLFVQNSIHSILIIKKLGFL
jgi:hypothetical protein